MPSNHPLTISYYREPDRLTITLGGDLDDAVRDQLVVISRYIAGLQPLDVTVDLGAVTGLSGTGLGFLAGLRNTVQAGGRILALTTVPEAIKATINASALGRVADDATVAWPVSHWFG